MIRFWKSTNYIGEKSVMQKFFSRLFQISVCLLAMTAISADDQLKSEESGEKNNIWHQYVVPQKEHMNALSRPDVSYTKIVHLSGEEAPRWIKGSDFDTQAYRCIQKVEQYNGIEGKGSFVITNFTLSNKDRWKERGEYYCDPLGKVVYISRVVLSDDFRYTVTVHSYILGSGKRTGSSEYQINYFDEKEGAANNGELLSGDPHIPAFSLPGDITSSNTLLKRLKVPADMVVPLFIHAQSE